MTNTQRPIKRQKTNTYAFLGVFIIFSALLFVQCHNSADHKAAVAELKAALPDTSLAQKSNLNPDTLGRAASANKEAGVAAQEKAPGSEAPSEMIGEFSLKSAKAVIKGTSSLHAWESAVTKMEGKGSFVSKNGELVAIKNASIKIAVNGIKSKEGKKMDNKTYETFHSDKYPNILYTFNNAVVKINASNTVTIASTGKLSMAGSTQTVSLSASGKKLSNGDLHLSVIKKIKMTDYNMKPPVMMLGTIKVGDEISVEFDFVLQRNK